MCWYILFRVERPWWEALRSINSQLNRVSVIHLEGTGRTLAPAGVELSSSNTRAGTHSNWQSILSVGNISQLLMQTQWPWQCACLTDLLYSHLFPMRTRRPVERGGVRVCVWWCSKFSHTWNQLEEAAKRADYCLDRFAGHFTNNPVQKTRHQKLSLTS